MLPCSPRSRPASPRFSARKPRGGSTAMATQNEGAAARLRRSERTRED